LQSYIAASGPAAGAKGTASQFEIYKETGMASQLVINIIFSVLLDW